MAKEKEKPLTREDVLKAIEENEGTAEGLDLSGKRFEESIDLHEVDLQGIILDGSVFLQKCEFGDPDDPQLVTKSIGANLQKVDLSNASLKNATLWEAQLQKSKFYYSKMQEADLLWAELQEANLSFAKFQGSRFVRANLYRADLHGSEFNTSTNFELASWGDYRLGEEEKGLLSWAEDTYRRLKIWHTEHGMYDIAGEFFFREMTVKRKMFWWGNVKEFSLKDLIRPFKPKEILRAIIPKRPLLWALLASYGILCGYGERPLRAIASAAVVVLGLALIYFAIGSLAPNTFLNSLYYSAVSFTALGYGSWAPQPTGWVKGLGAFEAFIGVFMMALFLVTFTRKMTR